MFTDAYLDAYIELKMQEVTRFRMATHPVEFDMYYTPVSVDRPAMHGQGAAQCRPFFVWIDGVGRLRRQLRDTAEPVHAHLARRMQS